MAERLAEYTRELRERSAVTDFVRWVSCLVDVEQFGGFVAEHFERKFPLSPNLELVRKAAVAAGNTTDANWAAPLTTLPAALARAFIDLVARASIIGRLEGAVRAPFNLIIPTLTAHGTFAWVTEGASKPATKLAFSGATLAPLKAGGLVVVTQELMKLAVPDAETVIRTALVNGLAEFLDSQFVDPAIAAVTGARAWELGASALTTVDIVFRWRVYLPLFVGVYAVTIPTDIIRYTCFARKT
jgi:HK97 family phage major capsid protein